MECDLVVLGSGPGGYPAAIRAAQLGASVVVVEQARGTVGGTCLNVGCIPTKAMVQSAHAYNDAQGHFAQLGVRLGNVDLDFEQVQSNRRGIVDGVVKGLAGLLKGNGIQVVKGRGRFSGPNTLAVEGAEDIQFKSAVIATGSRPAAPPIPGHRPPALHRLDRRARAGCRAAAPGRARRRCDRRRVRVHLRAVRLGRHGRRDAAQPDRRTRTPTPSPRLQRAFRRRGIAVELGARATGVEERDGDLVAALRDRRGRDQGARGRRRARRHRPRRERGGHRPRGRGRHGRAAPHPGRLAHAHERAAHLRRRRRRGQLAARAHGLPRGRDRGRERARARLRDRLPLDAALRLHGPGGRVGRASPRRRRASCTATTSWSGRCPTRRSRARRCTATARASSR